MAIGSHELLLIIRGQNQASAALGRVSSDLRRLERMRDLRMRQATLVNKAAQQTLKIMQTESALGSRNLAIQRAQLNVRNQIAHTQDRLAGLDQRQIAIQRGRANLDARRLNMEHRLTEFSGRRLQIESQLLKVEQQEAALQTKLAAGGAGGTARGSMALRRFNLGTQRMQREMALGNARRAASMIDEDTDPHQAQNRRTRQAIAERQLRAVGMQEALLRRQYGLQKKAMADLALTQKQLDNARSQSGAKAQALANREKELRVAIKNLEFGYESLNARERQILRTEDQMIRQLSVLKIREQEVAAAALEAAEAARIQGVQLAATNAELAEMNMMIANQKWDTLATAGRTVSHVGRVLQMFGLVATAAFAYAGKAAADFETETTLAATQAITASENSLVQIRKNSKLISDASTEILASGRSVASSKELTDSFYSILSGVPQLQRGSGPDRIAKTTKLIKELNEVAKANFGLVDMNGVVQAGITIIDTFGIRVGGIGKQLDIMQSAVNRGRLTMGQFVEGLNQTAPAAKAAGYNFEQMASTLSFLSTKFPSYTRAAVGYARLTEMFANPKFVDNLREQGVVITDVTGKHLLPFEQVVDRIVKKFPELAQGGLKLQNFFKTTSGQAGTIASRRAFAVTATDQPGLADFRRAVPRNAPGLVRASAEAAGETGAVKLKEFRNQLKALEIQLGQGAIPALVSLAKHFATVAKWFNNLSDSNKRAIGYTATMIAALTLLSGIFLTIAGGLTSMLVAGRAFVKWLGASRASTAALSGELGAISTRLALGMGILAVIPILILFHKQVGQVVDVLGGMHNVIEVLTIAMFAWPIAKMVSNMGLLAPATSAAVRNIGMYTTATEVATTRSAAFLGVLRSLALMGVIVIGVELVLHKDAIDNIGNKIDDYIGKHWLFGANVEFFGNKNKQRQAANDAAFNANSQRIFGNPRDNGFRAPATHIAPGLTSERGQNRVYGAATRANTVPGGLGGSGFAGAFTDKDIVAAARNIARLHKIAEKTPNPKNYRAYYAAQAALEKKASKEQLQIAQDLISAYESVDNTTTKKRTSAAKKRAAALKKINDDAAQQAAQNYQTMLGTLSSNFQSFHQQNQSQMGTLFSGPVISGARVQNNLQWGGKVTGGNLLADLRAQVSKFDQFRRVLDQLGKRGAPYELIQQIQQMGPEALDQARLLLKMSSKDFRAYTKVFRRGQRAVDTATRVDMTNQLAHWRSFGQNMAKQILLGLKDEKSPTETYLKGLLESLGVKTTGTNKNTAAQKAYNEYHYHGGTMDYSTWLRKSKYFHKGR